MRQAHCITCIHAETVVRNVIGSNKRLLIAIPIASNVTDHNTV